VLAGALTAIRDEARVTLPARDSSDAPLFDLP